MKTYYVTLEEKSSFTVKVQAKNKKEAEQKTNDGDYDGKMYGYECHDRVVTHVEEA